MRFTSKQARSKTPSTDLRSAWCGKPLFFMRSIVALALVTGCSAFPGGGASNSSDAQEATNGSYIRNDDTYVPGAGEGGCVAFCETFGAWGIGDIGSTLRNPEAWWNNEVDAVSYTLRKVETVCATSGETFTDDEGNVTAATHYFKYACERETARGISTDVAAFGPRAHRVQYCATRQPNAAECAEARNTATEAVSESEENSEAGTATMNAGTTVANVLRLEDVKDVTTGAGLVALGMEQAAHSTANAPSGNNSKGKCSYHDLGGAGFLRCLEANNVPSEGGNEVMCPYFDLGEEEFQKCIAAVETRRADSSEAGNNEVVEEPNGEGAVEFPPAYRPRTQTVPDAKVSNVLVAGLGDSATVGTDGGVATETSFAEEAAELKQFVDAVAFDCQPPGGAGDMQQACEDFLVVQAEDPEFAEAVLSDARQAADFFGSLQPELATYVNEHPVLEPAVKLQNALGDAELKADELVAAINNPEATHEQKRGALVEAVAVACVAAEQANSTPGAEDVLPEELFELGALSCEDITFHAINKSMEASGQVKKTKECVSLVTKWQLAQRDEATSTGAEEGDASAWTEEDLGQYTSLGCPGQLIGLAADEQEASEAPSAEQNEEQTAEARPESCLAWREGATVYAARSATFRQEPELDQLTGAGQPNVIMGLSRSASMTLESICAPRACGGTQSFCKVSHPDSGMIGYVDGTSLSLTRPSGLSAPDSLGSPLTPPPARDGSNPEVTGNQPPASNPPSTTSERGSSAGGCQVGSGQGTSGFAGMLLMSLLMSVCLVRRPNRRRGAQEVPCK